MHEITKSEHLHYNGRYEINLTARHYRSSLNVEV